MFCVRNANFKKKKEKAMLNNLPLDESALGSKYICDILKCCKPCMQGMGQYPTTNLLYGLYCFFHEGK